MTDEVAHQAIDNVKIKAQEFHSTIVITTIVLKISVDR